MKLSRRAALRTALFLATPWVIGAQQRLNAKNTTNESSKKNRSSLLGLASLASLLLDIYKTTGIRSQS